METTLNNRSRIATEYSLAISALLMARHAEVSKSQCQ
jgi:hypothetical protein